MESDDLALSGSPMPGASKKAPQQKKPNQTFESEESA